MWKGSFPRPTPDTVSGSSSLGDVIDLAKDLNYICPLSIPLGNYTDDYIAIYNKIAIYKRTVYNISNPGMPVFLFNLLGGFTYMPITNDILIASTDLSNIKYQDITGNVISTKPFYSISKMCTDGENIFIFDGYGGGHLYKQKFDGQGVTIWDCTFSSSDGNYLQDLFVYPDTNYPYIYAIWGSTSGGVGAKIYKIDKATGAKVATSASYLTSSNYSNVFDINMSTGDILVRIGEPTTTSSSFKILDKDLNIKGTINFTGGTGEDGTYAQFVGDYIYTIVSYESNNHYSYVTIYNSQFQSLSGIGIYNSQLNNNSERGRVWFKGKNKSIINFSTTLPNNGGVYRNIQLLLNKIERVF